ncbi:hypothetical protein L798_14829 [Zootermopsis nevadensis]|uniref:Uncharacterized protein n=1 Tax=Zootermopsis nevadensis TaxID=136037 RepID=A0A067QXH9_ZOONE|nr:hypothetical protein L798_14829 [Zootermopsis nevadensis]
MDFCSIQLGGSGLTKSAANDMPVYELEVIACLTSSSICQSHLFGQPARLCPTQCWHLEWEELLANQQFFMALCKKLCERDQYLLTRIKQHFHSINELSGHFILESDGSELLLKAAVSAELMLPTREVGLPCLSDDRMIHKMMNTVSNCLDHLPLMEEYKPSDFPSGLYSILARNLQHNTLVGSSGHPGPDVSPSELRTREGTKRNRGSSSSSKK